MVAMWPHRTPSRLRAILTAVLAVIVGVGSLTVLTRPYLPDREGLYGRILESARSRAPELLLEAEGELEIVQRGIRQRQIVVSPDAMPGPTIEVILAVVCLLLAAV